MDTPRRPKRRDERGASLVEFALVVTLLCALLLGIIVFGLLLSKRHALTQAAAEGARYAVPVSYTYLAPDNAMNAARTKTNQSLESIGGRQCPAGTLSNGVAIGTLGADGIRCTFTIFDCTSSPHVQTGGDTYDCIEVKVEVSVNHNPKIVPGTSFIDPFLPDTMTGTSIVSLSGLS